MGYTLVVGTSHATRRAKLLASLQSGLDAPEQAAAAAELGDLEAKSGDLGEALVHLDLARRIFGELGDARRAAGAEGRLAHALALRGDHERAAVLLDEALTEAEDTGDEELRHRLEMLAADAAARAGDEARARAGWERARVYFEAAPDPAALGAIYTGLARLDLERGELERAGKLAARALAEAQRAGDARLTGLAMAAQAEVFLRSGDGGAADRAFREATRILEEAGEERTLAEVYLAHGVLLGIGAGAMAATWLARAHTMFRAQGAIRDVARAREELRRYGRRATDRLGGISTAARQAELARARVALVAAARSGDPRAVDSAAAELMRAEEGLSRAIDYLSADREGVHTMLDLLRDLAGTLDDAALSHEIARAGAQLTGAERAVVALVEEQGGPPHLAGSSRMPEAARSWPHTVERASGPRGSPAFIGASALVAPLRRAATVLGAIYCDKGITGGTFEKRELELLAGFAGLATVILENARAAGALRVEARARAATLESITDGVLALAPGGQITSWNAAAARLLGGPPGTTLEPWPDLAAAASSSVDLEAVPLTLPGGSCLLSLRAIRGDAGQIVGRVVVLVELRRAARLAQRLSGAAPLGTFADLLGTTPLLQRRLKLAASAAEGHAPILVSGETGTGKRLLAQAIHGASPRARGPFVMLDCSSLSRETLEGELFGGAGRPGKIELADGGTLVLVEVAELPAPAQARLAMLLALGVVRDGGGELRPDVRLIATTTRELPARFHRELRERLRAVHVEMPALRERVEDMPLLVERILSRIAARLSKKLEGASPEVLDALAAYPWPGNVRELEQVLEAEAQGAPADLEILFEIPAMLLPGSTLQADGPRGPRSLLEAEHQLLVTALKQHRGNVPRVARSLGVSKGTVYNMMRKFRVDPSSFRVS